MSCSVLNRLLQLKEYECACILGDVNMLRQISVLAVLLVTSVVMAKEVTTVAQSAATVPAKSAVEKTISRLSPISWFHKLTELTAGRFRESASFDAALWSIKANKINVKTAMQTQADSMSKTQKKNPSRADIPCSTAVISS